MKEGDSYTIRTASREDIPFFQSVFEGNWKHNYREHYSSGLIDAVLTNDNTVESWQKGFDEGKVFFIISYLGNDAGFAGVHHNELIRLGVKQEYQGKGLGHLLTDHREEFIRKNNYDSVWTDVSLQAVDFHKDHGYVVQKPIMKKPYGFEMPMIRMVKYFE